MVPGGLGSMAKGTNRPGVATPEPRRKRLPRARGLTGVLGSLTPEELATVARHLLSQRPELVGVAETIAVELYSGPSIESVASDVLGVLTLLDIQDVDTTDPLGGYVEPGEAACEALREHVSEFVDDMKRIGAPNLRWPRPPEKKSESNH